MFVNAIFYFKVKPLYERIALLPFVIAVSLLVVVSAVVTVAVVVVVSDTLELFGITTGIVVTVVVVVFISVGVLPFILLVEVRFIVAGFSLSVFLDSTS